MTKRWSVLIPAFILGAFALWWGGNLAYYKVFIESQPFPRIAPDDISLIGLQLRDERIIVSNGIAQLVRGNFGDFGADIESSGDMSGAAEGPRVPMKALIGTLRLEPPAASELVASLNEIDTADNPAPESIWDERDVLAALEGDAKARIKLETDLSTRLDGSASDAITPSLIRTGIFIRTRVQVQVPGAAGKKETVVAEILQPYRTRIASEVANHKLIREGFQPTRAAWEGVYDEVWRSAQEAGSVEDVAGSLRSLLSEERRKRLAQPAEQLLERVTVLLNSKFVRGADYEAVPRPNGKGDWYTVNLQISTEGRNRLWRYTHERPRCQLLLVVDGVAIAAPIVQHEMKYSTIAITGVADEDLAQDAVNAVKGVPGSETS